MVQYFALWLSLMVCCRQWVEFGGLRTTRLEMRLDAIDDQALQNVESRPGEWLAHGRDTGEQSVQSARPQSTPDNVAKLGLAWSYSKPGQVVVWRRRR